MVFLQPQRLVALFLLCVSSLVYGSETVLEIKQDSPNTKKAVQTAIQQVSNDLMQKFIEPKKLKEQKKQIQKIISTYSNRYILYTHTASPAKQEDFFVITVTIGFSEENLKKILLEEDLFYSGASQLRVLPLILFEDLVERENYSWWRNIKPPSEDIKQQISALYNQIQRTLMLYGFFLINPEQAGSVYFIPEELKFKVPKKTSIFKLAQFFQSHLVMAGSVKIRESDVDSILNLKLEIAVYHAKSGRLLSEIERLEKIPRKKNQKVMPVAFFLKKNKNFAKGLGAQLKYIYQAGQISSNLLKITVKGNLSYRSSNLFQQMLISKVKNIKDLTENIIKSNSITYIANTSADTENISKKIQDTLFPGFYVYVSKVKKNEIILTVTLKK